MLMVTQDSTGHSREILDFFQMGLRNVRELGVNHGGGDDVYGDQSMDMLLTHVYYDRLQHLHLGKRIMLAMDVRQLIAGYAPSLSSLWICGSTTTKRPCEVFAGLAEQVLSDEHQCPHSNKVDIEIGWREAWRRGRGSWREVS